MAKNERVKIYNKGGRHWPLKDNGKDVNCDPGSSVELDKNVADILVKNYPDEFIHGEKFTPAVSGDIKKLKIELKTLKVEISKLEKENATLRQQIISRNESKRSANKE